MIVLTPERFRDLACSTVLMAFRRGLVVKEREFAEEFLSGWKGKEGRA